MHGCGASPRPARRQRATQAPPARRLRAAWRSPPVLTSPCPADCAWPCTDICACSTACAWHSPSALPRSSASGARSSTSHRRSSQRSAGARVPHAGCRVRRPYAMPAMPSQHNGVRVSVCGVCVSTCEKVTVARQRTKGRCPAATPRAARTLSLPGAAETRNPTAVCRMETNQRVSC